jgi:hypothetical protein
LRLDRKQAQKSDTKLAPKTGVWFLRESPGLVNKLNGHADQYGIEKLVG